MTIEEAIKSAGVRKKAKRMDQRNWFWSMATVSNWMPLPEPPEEDGHA